MRKSWKRTVVGAVAAMAVAGWTGMAGAVTNPCGDLNNDGKVLQGDALLLLQVASGASTGTSLCGGQGAVACGDLNKDGGITVADVVLLLTKATGGNPAFFCTGTGNQIAAGTNVRGTITQNQVWVGGTEACCACDASNTIFIDGTVFVAPGVTITVKPGTCVKGKKTSFDGSASVLVVQPGAKINAAGTATCPIVMTSDQAPGSRSKGDWGGLVLNGSAPVNCPGGTCQAEGLSNVPFGGTDPNDSSGTIRFVRVEFSGIELSPDNELNILTQNGIGRGTSMDHIQTNVGFDDCFEWFGGTVNDKFMVASGCGDDIYDWQLATSGAFQYAVGVDNQANLQPGNGNNGFEGDNNENGFGFAPVSNPKFCNFTLIGSKDQPSASGGFGALLRRGTAGKIANTILTKFFSGGISLRDDVTSTHACSDHTHLQTVEPILDVQHTMLVDNGGDATHQVQINQSLTSPACSGNEWFDMLVAQRHVTPARGATNVGSDPHIDTTYPTSGTTSQWIPTGVTCPSADPLCDAADCHALDDTLDTTNYVGAFKPGGGAADNWLNPVPGSCWVDFSQN